MKEIIRIWYTKLLLGKYKENFEIILRFLDRKILENINLQLKGVIQYCFYELLIPPVIIILLGVLVYYIGWNRKYFLFSK